MRRPTINFFQWKFSVDLQETKNIQNQVGLPAFGCECEDCFIWRKNYKHNLPEDLLISFGRVGIDLDHPADCYRSNDTLRVIFHFVGEIQSGPDSKIFDKYLNENIMNHVQVRKDPRLSIMVLPVRDSYEARPKRSNMSDQDIVCIDIRLTIN